eukprot:930642-Prorocentrum_minimum.AAC.1
MSAASAALAEERGGHSADGARPRGVRCALQDPADYGMDLLGMDELGGQEPKSQWGGDTGPKS